jgi:hypothetical protein
MCGWSIMSATRLETDVLMAESTLVTVLGGFAARIDVAILPAASQESMAARQHRGFVVENAVGLTSGLALWIIDGLAKVDRVIVAANGVGGTLSGIVLVCKIRDMTGDYRHGAAQVCPTARRLGKASEKNCRLSFR